MRVSSILKGIDIRTLLVLLTALAVVGAYWAAVSLSRDYYVIESPAGSVFNSDEAGLSVLYRYLDALDVEVETLHSFEELPAEGTIVVAAETPFVKPPTSAEGTRLAEWVAGGGRLVLAGPQAREVVRGAQISGSAGPSSPSEVLEPRLPSASFDGVERVRMGPRRLLADSASWATHLGDGSGQAMLSRAHGEGEIVWIAAVHPLSNGGLAEEDNARFATLLTAAAPGPVYFDEYHHGFVRGGGVWERLGPGGRAASSLVLAALLVTIVALAQRFGRPIEPAPVVAARTGAYIGSLAELYRKAGARTEALATLEEGVRLALVRRHGTEDAGRAAHPSAARALDGSAAARAGGAGGIDADRFTEIAGALARARREVEGLDG